LNSGAEATAKKEEIAYVQFLQHVKDGNIAKVVVIERDLYGVYADSKVADNFEKSPSRVYDFRTYIPSTEQFYADVRTVLGEENLSVLDFGFEINAKPAAESTWWQVLLPWVVLFGLIALMYFVIIRQQNKQTGSMTSFGKSPAKRHLQDNKKQVTFADVAGADEEKEELKEVVDFLRDPKRFLDLGARIPKGILLVGPPGTGKTLLAKAVSGEAGVPFFSISGSNFVEMFVGVGASRVRDLFEEAKKSQPAIIFIDEIDAVGRQRGTGLGGGHDEREQTLNQLLVEMDGFTVNEGIIVIAATNRSDILDPALLRPGRFDRQIVVNYPDVKGREEILRVHAKGKPLAADVNLNTIARMTPWTTGADLENILNEAAILAARAKKSEITMFEVTEAVQRVALGPEKRSRVVTPHDKKLVAYHEAGHAVVADKLPNADPVKEVSIVPRGMAGGYTQSLPSEDSNYLTQGQLLDRIAMSMGGHAAERLMMKDISTGATSDLKSATETARRMITEFGMSKTMGPVYLGAGKEVFIGRDFGAQHPYSEQVAADIDRETKSILENAYNRATEILKAHMDKLELVASTLLEKEKIDGDEFRKLMDSDDAPAGGANGRIIPEPALS
ncbi:MAG: ATP-dependent zinc metalloprotease FtsH, partial [Christensenellales bacterium]